MKFNEIKKATGFTQKELAVYLDIPLRTIENWCSNKNQPPEYVIDLIEYKLKKEGILNE